MRWITVLVGLSATALSAGQSVNVWLVDPLVKVFKDSAPLDTGTIAPIQVAKGEVAEWQVVLRSHQPLANLKVRVSDLRRDDDPKGALGRPKVRFLGYVPVDRSMAKPAKDLLRKAPSEYPDPLMPTPPAQLPADTDQPIWIDLAIPATAKPGAYSATATIEATAEGKGLRMKVALQAVVRNVRVGKSRLWVTNWFNTTTGHMPGSNQPGTDAEIHYLERIAKSMAAHRQNVVIISPLNLGKCTWDAKGGLHVDFDRFDTWVRIFQKAGVLGRIEGGHFGGRVTSDWDSQFGMNIRVPQGSNVVTKSVAPDSPEAHAFYSQFLPLLVAHLKKKRWWTRYCQHLGDEPIDANAKTYRQMADLVHKYAPGMKIIEASQTEKVADCINVWVPQLDFANKGYAFYKARQQAGDEFWTYTCVWPEGEYANRFIELPLIKTRLLHWINFRYNITGYLHWGYNYWVKTDPFDDLTRTKAKDGWGGFLPAGDSWIVYPKDGALLDSIRFETMRDGIADYELLSMLAEKDPKAAHRLAETLILAFDSYNTDVPTFRSVRKQLFDRLEQ